MEDLGRNREPEVGLAVWEYVTRLGCRWFRPVMHMLNMPGSKSHYVAGGRANDNEAFTKYCTHCGTVSPPPPITSTDTWELESL